MFSRRTNSPGLSPFYPTYRLPITVVRWQRVTQKKPGRSEERLARPSLGTHEHAATRRRPAPAEQSSLDRVEPGFGA